jgi:hypothetical protein
MKRIKRQYKASWKAIKGLLFWQVAIALKFTILKSIVVDHRVKDSAGRYVCAQVETLNSKENLRKVTRKFFIA